MRQPLGTLVAVSLVLAPVAGATAESGDTLLQAVAFALTGSDDAKVRVINRAQCVFGIDHKKAPGGISAEVFHLNNIQVERLAIQGWLQKTNRGETRTVTVDLHGDSVVYEQTREGGDTEGVPSAILDNIRKSGPEWFTRHVIPSNEQQLTLSTSETERVNRAWQYIYANGCVAKKSPF
jgi:hypothetical protein